MGKSSEPKKTRVKKMQPASYRHGTQAWGYQRRGAVWIPNRRDNEDPDMFKLDDLVEMHLRCRNIRREFHEHPTISTVADLTKALGFVQHATVSKPLNGIVPLTDDMFAGWVAALGNKNLYPTKAEHEAEHEAALREIDVYRRTGKPAAPAPRKVSHLVTAAVSGPGPVVSIGGRPDEAMDDFEWFEDRVARVATPALEAAIRHAHRSIGGDGNVDDITLQFLNAETGPSPLHPWDRVNGSVYPTDTEAWCRVWLTRRWLHLVDQGDPMLIDDVFVLSVQHRDPDGRPTYVIGIRAVPEPPDAENPDWVLRAATAHITWNTDGTPTLSWGIDNPADAYTANDTIIHP